MMTKLHYFILCALLAAAGLRAEEIQLHVELTDGSTITGPSNLQQLHVRWQGKRLSVDVNRLSHLEVHDWGQAKISLTNGDTITGELDDASLTVHSPLGEVQVPIPNVRSLAVWSADGLPTNRLLWYSNMDKVADTDKLLAGEPEMAPGVLRGTKPGTDRFDHADAAVIFDGRADRVDISAACAELSTTEHTIAAWVRIDSFSRAFSYIFGQWHRLAIFISPHGSLAYRFDQQARSDRRQRPVSTEVVMPEPVPRNEWFFVVATFNKGEGVLYYNGEEVGRKTGTDQPIDLASRNFSLGFKNREDKAYLHGAIDEVMIFNTALTPAQVARLADLTSHSDFIP